MSVKQTAHLTRVRLVARNNTAMALDLPAGYCLFVGNNAKTLQGDEFDSRGWSSQLAPGGDAQSGTIIFKDRLSDSVGRATLSFTTVFGAGGPGSIRVPNIMLRSS